jgi:hypothetical protein
MYAFRNVALTNFIEGGGMGTAYTNTYAAQTVTTSGAKRLAVSFEAIGTNVPLDSITGETPNPPYDWTMPGGSRSSTGWFNGAIGNSLFSLGIQTATMTNQGTISGGTDIGNTCYWIVRSFALIPR